MPTCPNCKTQLPEDAKFCSSCGVTVTRAAFCPQCGQPMSADAAFCPNCAAAGQSAAPTVISGQPANVRPVKAKSGRNLKPLIIAAAAVILVAAAVLSILFFLRLGGANQEFALYLKDDELNYSRTQKVEPVELTDSLYEGTIEESESFAVSFLTLISKDGKMIFYPDKISDGGSGCSIYYRYLNKLEQDAEKLDSEIIQYAVNDQANLITYIKGEDRNLYQNNLTEKEKIGSGVTDFFISDDGSKIVYFDDESNIYVKNGAEDKEKIDSDSFFLHVSADLKTIYYLKNDNLYKKQEGQDKVKISSNVYRVIDIYDSGEIFFYKSDSKDVKLSEYVDDDMAAADAAFQMPEMPAYPNWWEYTTIDDYDQAVAEYNTAYAAYETAEAAYYDKLTRDDLRASLDSQTTSITQSTLYYYNGTEEKTIADTYVANSENLARDKAVMIYQTYKQSQIKKFKLSELGSVSEIEGMVQQALYTNTENNLLIGGETSAFDQAEPSDIQFNAAGTELYYVDCKEGETEGDLCRIAIVDGKAQEPETYDTEVSTTGMRFAWGTNLLYYKNVNDDSGELYIDKVKIDYDVKLLSETYSKDKKAIIYFSDWDSDKQLGTLEVYADGKIVKISDDVHSFIARSSSDILYLYDFSITRSKGELHLYDGSEDKLKIDDDVTAIIKIYQSPVMAGSTSNLHTH